MLDFYIVCLTFVRIIFPKIMPDWISAIAAFVTLLLTSYTIWRDFFKNISHSTSKKLKINRLDCLVETGNATDQTHAFTAITLEIENTLTPILKSFNPYPITIFLPILNAPEGNST